MSPPPTAGRADPQTVLVRFALIVEDEADIAELLRQHIAPLADRVAVVATCADARRSIAEQPIGLVILDLNLPDGDGLELCQQSCVDECRHRSWNWVTTSGRAQWSTDCWR